MARPSGFWRRACHQRGFTNVEYGLILGLVALVVVATLGGLGQAAAAVLAPGPKLLGQNPTTFKMTPGGVFGSSTAACVLSCQGGGLAPPTGAVYSQDFEQQATGQSTNGLGGLCSYPGNCRGWGSWSAVLGSFWGEGAPYDYRLDGNGGEGMAVSGNPDWQDHGVTIYGGFGYGSGIGIHVQVSGTAITGFFLLRDASSTGQPLLVLTKRSARGAYSVLSVVPVNGGAWNYLRLAYAGSTVQGFASNNPYTMSTSTSAVNDGTLPNGQDALVTGVKPQASSTAQIVTSTPYFDWNVGDNAAQVGAYPTGVGQISGGFGFAALSFVRSYTGFASLTISNPTGSDTHVDSSAFPVSGNTHYTVTAAIAAAAVFGTGAYIDVIEMNAGGAVVKDWGSTAMTPLTGDSSATCGGGVSSCPTTTPWVPVSFQLTTQPGTTQMSVQYHLNGSGQAWFDSVTVS